jgi:hypothetical protein
MSHWLDHLYVRLTRPGAFFSNGWGDASLIERLTSERFPASFDAPRIEWSATRSRGGVSFRDGTFTSPLASLLPRESRTAHVRWLLAAPSSGALCLLLGATGDEGFGRRSRWAAPLVRRGIDALILENPLYGLRRPTGQRGVDLRTVAELLLLGRAAVEEGRALAKWTHDRGVRVAISGYSMGGQLAAMTGVLVPFPSAIVPAASPSSATAVFVDGLLSRATAWEELGDEESSTRTRLASMLDGTALHTMPRPVAPHAAIVLGARSDGYVQPHHVEALHRHWAGAELRWVRGGHVSGYVLGAVAIRRAVIDALARLT